MPARYAIFSRFVQRLPTYHSSDAVAEPLGDGFVVEESLVHEAVGVPQALHHVVDEAVVATLVALVSRERALGHGVREGLGSRVRNGRRIREGHGHGRGEREQGGEDEEKLHHPWFFFG